MNILQIIHCASVYLFHLFQVMNESSKALQIDQKMRFEWIEKEGINGRREEIWFPSIRFVWIQLFPLNLQTSARVRSLKLLI